MRGYDKVRVVEGVNHLVAPRDARAGLTLSEAALPLDGGVGEFLAGHVTSGLSDPQALAGRFVVRESDRTADVCRRILLPSADIVALSTLLAERLYAIAQSDQRQKDGTFVTLLCEAEEQSQPVRFVALLKLDPADAYRSVTDQDPVTGKRRVRFELNHGILPTAKERLQKSAFVRLGGDGVEYELLAVDRLRDAGTVGRFWLEDFLGSEAVLNAADRTTKLYRALRQARNAVESDLDAGQLSALEQVINGTVVQRRVNLDNLVEGLPIPDVVRSKVADILKTALPDREFDLDQVVARQFLRRKRYQADNGLKLTVPAEFEDMIHVEDLDGDGDDRLRKISFETRAWKES